MNKIVHSNSLSLGQALSPEFVRIDRSSEWGNPFIVSSQMDRDQVVDAYKVYLWKRMRKSATSHFSIRMVQTLNNKTLVCWCAPKRCHGEVLRDAVAWVIAESKKPLDSERI